LETIPEFPGCILTTIPEFLMIEGAYNIGTPPTGAEGAEANNTFSKPLFL